MNTQIQKIKFKLPLPSSKNKRLGFVRGRVFSTKEVKNYYEEVCDIIYYELRLSNNFKPEKMIVIECDWYVRRANQDVHNFHDVLADALEKAFKINDKFFLIRDMDKQIDKENPRVELKMFYLNNENNEKWKTKITSK